MDQAIQEIQLPVMENLFNILVEIPESSEIHKEWDNYEKMNQGMDRQEVGKQTRRKWRRIKRKENLEMESGGKKISELNKGGEETMDIA